MRTTAKVKASEHTSYEVRRRWDQENLKRYVVSLHTKNDSDLIDFVEANKDKCGTTEIFRKALEKLKNEG